MAQREDLGHQRAVVPLSRMRPSVRGPRDPGFVESAAQRFVGGVGQHCLVGRRIERKQPACRSCCFGGGTCAMHRIGGQAVELAFVDDVPGPRVGRVEHVLVELRLRGGEPLHDLAEALLAVVRQRDAGETEIAQRVLDQLALLGREGRAGTVRHALVGGAELGVLAELGVVCGQQRQAGVVGGAQIVTVHHAVQVADGRPGARQPVVHALDRDDQGVPLVCARSEQRRDLAPVGVQQLANGRLDVARFNGAESGQRGIGQQRVGHGPILAQSSAQPKTPCSGQPSA